MLTVANVYAKVQEEQEAFQDLGSLKKKYDNLAKAGGPIKLQMLTYHPPTQKFHWQTPSTFVPVNSTSKVLTVAIELDKDTVYEREIDVVTKLLVQTNGVATSVLVGALKNLANNGIKVAYVQDPTAAKPEIKWCPIKRIYDPIDEAKKVQNSDKVKKAGRPKKVPLAQESKPRITPESTFDVVKLDTRDGSLYVCENFIMK